MSDCSGISRTLQPVCVHLGCANWPLVVVSQAERCRRLPRQCHPRTAAGTLACHQHRPHEFLPCQAFQHLAGCCHQAKCQRCHGIRVSLQDVWRDDCLLREDQRGEHKKQLCTDLRATGWWDVSLTCYVIGPSKTLSLVCRGNPWNSFNLFHRSELLFLLSNATCSGSMNNVSSTHPSVGHGSLHWSCEIYKWGSWNFPSTRPEM